MSGLSKIFAALFFSCLVFSPGIAIPQNEAQLKTPEGEQSKTVVDMSIEELIQHYSEELSDVEFDPIQNGLDSLLKKTGSRVEAFFLNLSNTSSREQVFLQRLTFAGHIQRSSKKEFYYLILPAKEGLDWREDRTDKKGRPVSQKDMINALHDLCISSGYAQLCLYLHPAYQAGSSFRYLGRTKYEPHAHVIAFAQKPQRGVYLASYSNLNAIIRYLVQGFVWINPDNHQIVRMQTGMLSPNDVLMQQTTDVSYIEISFDGVQQRFWLPHQVTVIWTLSSGVIYRNEHVYSDYHLFAVESGYKIGAPPMK